MERTEIHRDPEKVRAWQDRSRQELPKQSAKGKDRSRARQRAMRVVRKRAGNKCEVPGLYGIRCRGILDGHEPLNRSAGGDETTPATIVLICRAHHYYSHAHPNAARKAGMKL